MKQHITIEQLLELKDFINISKYTGISILRFLGGGEKPPYEDITIGKMIEIIINTGNDWMIGPDYYDLVDFKECFLVDYKDVRVLKDELCDALWEVMKVIIDE